VFTKWIGAPASKRETSSHAALSAQNTRWRPRIQRSPGRVFASCGNGGTSSSETSIGESAMDVSEDDVPPLPQEAKTRPGRSLDPRSPPCVLRDSAAWDDVSRLLAGAPIHLVNTDPPLWGARRAALEQRDRSGSLVLHRYEPPPEARPSRAIPRRRRQRARRCGRRIVRS